ncbi:Hypothetical predicted protein, partial [Scomber scombrus]
MEAETLQKVSKGEKKPVSCSGSLPPLYPFTPNPNLYPGCPGALPRLSRSFTPAVPEQRGEAESEAEGGALSPGQESAEGS